MTDIPTGSRWRGIFPTTPGFEPREVVVSITGTCWTKAHFRIEDGQRRGALPTAAFVRRFRRCD